MIIGIDDSGNFETDEVSFYASAFIRPKRKAKIEKVFLEWEKCLPDSVKENGEVKGHKLNQEQLLEFIDKVLINNGYGAVKQQAFGIQINEHNTNFLEGQRKHQVQQMRDGAKEYQSQGKKFFLIAGQYNQMADWFDSKSLKTLYKMELLGIAIVKSLNLAIITSTLRDFDKELGKLEMNIDEGIAGRASVESYWRDAMRTMFWNITSRIEPLIHVTTWRSNHPFIKRFNQHPKSTESLAMFTHEIKKMMQFRDSKDYFEIRIADIIASTYFRKYVKNENLDDAIKLLNTQRVMFGNPFIRVSMGDGEKDPNPINPYTDRIEGVTADEIKEKYGEE
jgi:hypothetical protein